MECHCMRCGYDWISKKDNPEQCPKCKQYYWSKPAGWEYMPEYKKEKAQMQKPNILDGVNEPNDSEKKNDAGIKEDDSGKGGLDFS